MCILLINTGLEHVSKQTVFIHAILFGQHLIQCLPSILRNHMFTPILFCTKMSVLNNLFYVAAPYNPTKTKANALQLLDVSHKLHVRQRLALPILPYTVLTFLTSTIFYTCINSVRKCFVAISHPKNAQFAPAGFIAIDSYNMLVKTNAVVLIVQRQIYEWTKTTRTMVSTSGFAYHHNMCCAISRQQNCFNYIAIAMLL